MAVFSPSLREADAVMNHASSNKTLQRFAVILLFQFRVEYDGKSSKRRICEKRLIHVHAENARTALRRAKVYGRKASHSYGNSTSGTVYFEFVGVLDLLRLGIECQEGELCRANASKSTRIVATPLIETSEQA
jgi:hypothetical protein